MPIIPALVRLRQENWKFKTSLLYDQTLSQKKKKKRSSKRICLIFFPSHEQNILRTADVLSGPGASFSQMKAKSCIQTKHEYTKLTSPQNTYIIF
jgi:hypothetical protein